MDSIITPYQNAFIWGRNIIDNILIAHKILDILRKKKGRKNSFGILKINISKAYDRVDWNFLKPNLITMKFEPKWIKWIIECVTTVHYTLLVNGSITQSFKPSKGLSIPLSLPHVCQHPISSIHESEKFKGYYWDQNR